MISWRFSTEGLMPHSASPEDLLAQAQARSGGNHPRLCLTDGVLKIETPGAGIAFTIDYFTAETKKERGYLIAFYLANA